MLKRIGVIFLQILILSLVLFASYYLFILKPKAEYRKNISETSKILSLYKNVLTQNRLAYIALTKLNPDSANVNAEKSTALERLKIAQEDISEYTAIYNSISDIDNELSSRFPKIVSEVQNIVSRQKEILDKVYTTGSYEEGREILVSEESVELLTDETNLILEIEWWRERVGSM